MIGDIVMSNTAANKARRKETQARKELKKAEKKVRYQERVAKRPADYVAPTVEKEKPKTTSMKMFGLFRDIMINHKASKEAELNVIVKKIEKAVARQYQERRNANSNK